MITGRSSSRVSFKSHVGIGSNLQCLDGSDSAWASLLLNQIQDRNGKVQWSDDGAHYVTAGTGTESVKEDTKLETFLLKNLANLLASSLSDEWSGIIDDWFSDESDFTMLNSMFGVSICTKILEIRWPSIVDAFVAKNRILDDTVPCQHKALTWSYSGPPGAFVSLPPARLW